MNTTFILAHNFGVTPFEIMAQDIDEVIMVINYYLDRADEKNNNNTDNTKSEKEQDQSFWACL